MKTVYIKDLLIGGGATALDGIDGAGLLDKDPATVYKSGIAYTYVLNATSGAADDGINTIAPDTNPGTKRWILQSTALATGSALGTPASGVMTNTTTATAADNDATTELASTAFAKSQDAVLARDPDQEVAMTAAVSGSSGITVADNDNINNGLNNFAWIWKGSLLDWTGGTCLFINKNQSATDRIYIQHNITKKFYYVHQKTGFPLVNSIGAVAHTTPNGSAAEFVFAVTRESASVAGSVLIYCNGLLLDTLVIPAGTQVDITNTGVFSLMGYNGSRYAGTLIHSYILNFAPTAAGVLDMYRNGIPEAWKLANGQTALTSGTLVVGKNYQIDTFAAGDDFTNVATVIAGTINTAGCRFLCKATTPTVWANSSSLRPAVGTLILTPESWQSDKPYDLSSNNLVCSYPATGWNLTRPNPKKLWQPTPAAKTTAVTLTIAELLTGIITATHTAGATQAYELPTGALCDAWPVFGVNCFCEWSLINLSAAAADTVTITAHDNHTFVGNPIVQSAHVTTGGIYGNSAMFRTRKTALNTFITYRIS